ncbi:MAG: SDR family oxidoreductase [Rhodospirillaceae bacterium]|nr:SDR family oxidoreductase [Rhodospirillaceae bacterium]
MPYQSVFRPDLFAGQTIIVTGGGSGIGRCIAHELSALGAKVVLTGRSREQLEAVSAEIVEDGGSVDVEDFDIRAEDVVAEKVAAILERNGPIAGLVNNAGGQFVSLLEDMSQKGWETVIRTNLTGGFLMSRELVRQCMSEQGGAIVNITADFWNGMPYMGHSGAARAGMVNFTETAAIEWAHYGIRVNGVAPGIIASAGLDTYDDTAKARLKARMASLPMRRFGTEAEISAGVVFLLSPAAAFISGETLRADGAVPNMRPSYQVPDHERTESFQGFHRAVMPKFMDE